MARRARQAKLSRLSPDRAATLFAEHHIVGLRQRKTGEITQVKHATFGWMSPKEYYGLQKLHEAEPMARELIRGGYMFKAWIAGLSVGADIAGTGLTIPVGMGIIGTEVLNFFEELTRNPVDMKMLLVRAYALFGPFGDVLQIADFLGLLGPALGAVGSGLFGSSCETRKALVAKYRAQGETSAAEHEIAVAQSQGCDTSGW